MWSDLFEFAVVVLLAWLVWRFISHAIRLSRPSESGSGDPAGRPAALRPRPKSGAGAVAIAEPDDEDGNI